MQCNTVNNKYVKNFDKNTEIIILRIFRYKQFIWIRMSQKLSVDGFKWIEKDDVLKFDEKLL